MTTAFRLRPMDPAHADALRAAGGIVRLADSQPGYPCRQCLRDAEIGDELLLVSHDPFTAHSPYRCASPVFIHREPCTPPDASDPLPVQLTSRQLSVRAFDAQAMMTGAAVIDGSQLEGTLVHMFLDPAAEVIHVHNALPGCWAVNVVRC